MRIVVYKNIKHDKDLKECFDTDVQNFRSLDKNAYWKIIFLNSQPKHYVVGTQKNRFIETFLMSNQNTCLN